MLSKKEKRERRHKRVRAKIFGTAKIPRLCVFRSNQHIYAQLIDDEENKVITQASDKEVNALSGSKNIKVSGNKSLKSFEVGKLVAQKAYEKKIKKTVFDRGGYKYHGRVKALAEGAREKGLEF
jgi:large subunit ribosomal protein L18